MFVCIYAVKVAIYVPRAILSEVASLLIQKETHDNTTRRQQGTYTLIRKYPMCRHNIKRTVRIECGAVWDENCNIIHYINPFPVSHDFCRPLSRLFIFLGSLYSKQYEPSSDCSPGSSLAKAHIVCFQKKSNQVYLNICSRRKNLFPPLY